MTPRPPTARTIAAVNAITIELTTLMDRDLPEWVIDLIRDGEPSRPKATGGPLARHRLRTARL
jgi:hypothetical protein